MIEWRPFPVDLLPDAARRFVIETAGALDCDAAMVALPALAVLGGAIGAARAIELKPSWREFPIVWAAIVARSGSSKSSAMDAALAPLRDAQAVALHDYAAAEREHQRAALEYERSLAVWKRSKAGEPPEPPEAPTAARYVVSDTTVEALAPLLLQNPRGLLLARDELSAWLRGFDQYRARGRGGDAAAWLELHRGGSLIVDRKTGTPRTVHVRRAAVSVAGTIQPGVLAGALTCEHWESGFAARLLLAAPPTKVKRWTDRTPSRDALTTYGGIVRELLRLDFSGDGEPIAFRLTPEAHDEWVRWYDEMGERQADAGDDREAAALSKLEAYGARLALIHALAENPAADAVNADAIRAGCGLADWFGHEAERVYGLLGETDEDRAARELVDWVKRRGGSCSARDLSCSGPRRFRGDADVAEAALNTLVNAGRGAWQDSPPGPGRPSRTFRLLATPAAEPEANGQAPEDNGEPAAVAMERIEV